MIRRVFAFFAAAFAAATLAHATAEMPSRALAEMPARAEFFRAAHLPAVPVVALTGPVEKNVARSEDDGRMRVGSVRPLARSARTPDWIAIPEGYVSRLQASSDQAEGLRVRLDFGALEGPVEIRAQGNDGHVEFMRIEPWQGPEVWTPYTPGPTQVVEIFSAAPLAQPVSVGAVVHLDDSPFAKAASTCTVSTSCTTNDSVLDAAVAERVNSSVRLLFNEGTSAFVCSGTLINTDRFPAGYILTANHCISTVASTKTVTFLWFHQPTSCTDTTAKPGSVPQSSGATLVFTNYNPDSTLLLTTQTPPAGAVYAGWNASRVQPGQSVVSISHPKGDTSRLATGTLTKEYRITDRSQDEYGVSFDRGIIEGGSSGSGLFTLAGGSLQLRGILTGTTVRNDPGGMSCTNLTEEALYGRFEIFYPQMAQYLTASGPPADDAPNRVIDFTTGSETPLNGRTVNLDRRIDYIGDVDVFRFTLNATAEVSLSTQGTLDSVGTLMNSEGKYIETNDDIASGNVNFGITKTLDAGTYYVMVAPWEAAGTGAYRLVMTASAAVSTSSNYTDLWWNSSEPGWGINLAHQGNVIFATLYTYDTNGQPMWLYMSNGDRQSDGSFMGNLYRATGPAFNATPWGNYFPNPVGLMRIVFTSTNSATINYAVNGINVSKNITRYTFSTPTTCAWTDSDRSTATNYQDLWWNPSEPGWGVNLAHQGSTLFATLYTYDSSGGALWLSMSSGQLVAPRTYTGALHRTIGSAFNASPWTGYTPTQVGTMTFTFADGKTGTLSYTVNGVQVVKPIRRFEFGTPRPQCSP